MGSASQETSELPQSPEAMSEESTGCDGADTAPQRKHPSNALAFARNGIAALVLIAIMAFGTSSMSLNNPRPQEQVVHLGDTLEPNYSSTTGDKSSSSSLLNSRERGHHDHSREQKARARYHKRVKSQSHPDIGHAVTDSRRLMGMGGMGGGSGNSRSGSGRRTFMPTPQPSASPSASPTARSSAAPTQQPNTPPPSESPTLAPTVSKAPSRQPSISPSLAPSVSFQPSVSKQPSGAPSVSVQPSGIPSESPSGNPTVSSQPSGSPSKHPSAEPTAPPSRQPSAQPSFVFRTFPPTLAPTDGALRPSYSSRSGNNRMMGMGMGMNARAFEIGDDDRFDEQLQDLLQYLPADFIALFGNN